jgi:hypothetical protein
MQTADFVDVQTCLRCGGTHLALAFEPLTNPTTDLLYWATCPATGQPMLARADDDALRCSDTPTPRVGTCPTQTVSLFRILSELNGALDSGCRVSPDDAEQHLRTGDVFGWLAGALGTAVDLSPFADDSQEDAALAAQMLEAIDAHGTEARRRLRGQSNGLCLLLGAGLAVLHTVALPD